MEKRELLYEGKAKKVFATDDPDVCIVSYKDDATAFNGQKKGTILGKGAINNRVTNHLMRLLEKNGVPTHLLEELNDRETAVRRVGIVPLEVIVRNIAAGSLAKRLGLPEGARMQRTVLEYCYKDDALGDPMVNESHILAMGFATEEEMCIRDSHIAERVGPHLLPDLFDRHTAGDQTVAAVHVGAVIAGTDERRRGNAHMHLGRARLPQLPDNPGGGGAPDDRVVHHHHPLALDRGGQHVQLDAHEVFPLALRWLDKGPADVPVFNKADAVRDARLPGKAQRGVQAGIGHADDDVRLHRMLQRQIRAGAHPRLVDADALDDRVGPGKICLLYTSRCV